MGIPYAVVSYHSEPVGHLAGKSRYIGVDSIIDVPKSRIIGTAILYAKYEKRHLLHH